MLLRALCFVLLALGCHTAVAAEADAAADTAAASEASDSDDSTASSEASAEDSDSGETASASPLDGEGFVPSVQISEDLSVSFPTDI